MPWFRFQRRAAPYLFIAPFFLGYAIFWGYPVLNGFWTSLFSERRGGTQHWIGLRNYADLLHDDRFLHALRNTTLYALGSVFIIVPVALLIALILNVDGLKFRTLFRLAFFMPTVVGAAVIAIMFVLIFDSRYGILNNYLLRPVGLPAIGWLRDARWSLPTLILLGLWRYVGINSLYFLVGLSNVPTEVREAAAMDGATRWQIFRYVTLPILRPVTLFVVTLAIIGSYKLFAEPLILFGGAGPSDGALTITTYLYLTAFQSVRFGYAAAIGYALVVIIAILSLLQLRLFGAFRED